MTLSQPGSAAGEAALELIEVPRQRTRCNPIVAAQRDDSDSLLEAVRRGLAPGDPVARLLALWPAPPVRPVQVHATRPRRGLLPAPG